jgi:hypothetical protein
MNFLSVLPLSALLLSIAGCKGDDDLPPEPILPPEPAYLAENTITITTIADLPPGLTFDKVKADIQGVKWKIIDSVEAPYVQGKIVLTLPAGFAPDDLQQVEQTKGNLGGHWPATPSDPDTLVAKLGDLFAYSGEEKVGRIYLTDWSGKGSSSADKAFIYYHYADRPYAVSGQNLNLYGSKAFKPSYAYSLDFRTGWNVYANINPSNPGESGSLISCTTTLPDETQLQWRFESYD